MFRRCRELGTKNDSYKPNTCTFRIYAFSKEETIFMNPSKLNTIGIGGTLTINLTGNISAPGEIYYYTQMIYVSDIMYKWRVNR